VVLIVWRPWRQLKLRTIINILFPPPSQALSIRQHATMGQDALRPPIPYNRPMFVVSEGLGEPWTWAGVALLIILNGCVTDLPITGDSTNEAGSLAVGRIETMITGETKRIYEPSIRSFELVNRQTQERFRVDVRSDDQQFTLSLPPGEYELNRVQINEGPFMSMAQLSASFALQQGAITYLGTWRFGVDSPRYGRMVVLSMIVDEQDRDQAEEVIRQRYPARDVQSVVTVLPDPTESEARLYEVMSYPRVPRYFQRHQW
jgi:hypothetical protein